MDTYIEKIAQKAKPFEKASKLLLDLSFRLRHDRMFIKSLAEGKLGHDVVDWVNDIELFEKTGRKRGTTWARGRGKVDKRRARNTMGYHLARSDSVEVISSDA
ncbi:hypothetical protein H0H87_004284 [Tephrocybe sp. NHM501043]|nr:hypothetical protein H0H87_004284 [Tephrocybe sp. NHM501043]